MLLFALVTSFIFAMLITPAVIKAAHSLGAVDQPNARKVHLKEMPRLGGLSIYLAFIIGVAIVQLTQPLDFDLYIIIAGATIILLTGILDDIHEITPLMKLSGQIAAALLIALGGIQLEFINLPFGGTFEFGLMSIPLTVFWIVAITNSINLIDGLDGLASGVSAIALATIGFMAVLMGNTLVMVIAFILVAGILGFMRYNFFPAKIFMGDSGALFLGFMISILALQGFKNITVISLIIPLIILGVPLSDTFFAIIRRRFNKAKISQADKSHLHHCLINLGFTHRQTVLLIYSMAALFGVFAIIFSMSTIWGAIIVGLLLFVSIEIAVEMIGLVDKSYRPLLNFLRIAEKQQNKS
ncbi:glycosyltransferase family 4 protein [Jeotgalibacillus haloalkalitolerans]|uniref:MraY family glycosyltransferase n=1 Tax=Jeotgalibacillus haloalkalitolerans TaxID=3104292 RepID=A0ABU5KKM9_9BACL|nr:MraY family glycosyltransferase [Jeotgalibacillus sp. HH7-29]MDZ5711301.1 MraY family glycosyltransferase [Jeotgalibacillus sp. HH7-29]